MKVTGQGAHAAAVANAIVDFPVLTKEQLKAVLNPIVAPDAVTAMIDWLERTGAASGPCTLSFSPKEVRACVGAGSGPIAAAVSKEFKHQKVSLEQLRALLRGADVPPLDIFATQDALEASLLARVRKELQQVTSSLLT